MPVDGLFPDRDDAFLVTFAKRAQEARFEIDVAEFDVRDFADAQARGVHELQHGLVAEAEPGARVGRGQQPPDFFVIERVRKGPPELGRIDGLRDIGARSFSRERNRQNMWIAARWRERLRATQAALRRCRR